MQDAQQFNVEYEDLRQRFNRFAHEKGLADKINQLLVSEIELTQFNHEPYILHAVTDAALTPLEKLNCDLVHRLIDWRYDYNENKANNQLELQRKAVASELIETLRLLGIPRTYTSALAHQKLLLNINPHFLDKAHYEDFNQLREQVNLQLNRFLPEVLSERFTSIEADNQQLLDRQNQFLYSMRELERLQHTTLNGLQNLNDSVATKSEVEKLISELKNQGIEINDKLYAVLIQSTVTRQTLEQLVTYWKTEQYREHLREQQALKDARYQGVADSCHFLQQLGIYFDSPTLVNVSKITQAGIQIHRATDQILSAGTFSLAVLSPYAAIGSAILSIFSLFKQEQNPQQQIMRQLAQLSKQINALHREVKQIGRETNEKLSSVLQKLTDLFPNLIASTRVPIARKLSEIQSELAVLNKITRLGFEELRLNDLMSIKSHVQDIEEDITGMTMTEALYEDYMRRLRTYATETACAPLVNGTAYQSLLKASAETTHQFIEVLDIENTHSLLGLLGLITIYARDFLKIPDFQSIEPRQIFHPEIWRITVETYLFLKKRYSNFQYDAKNIILNVFSKQAKIVMDLIHQFRFNPNLYEELFSQLISHTVAMENIRTELSACNADSLIASESIDKTMQSFANHYPQHPQIHYELPPHLHGHKESENATEQFFKTTNLMELLHKQGKIIPAEFLYAEHLGLGIFNYEFHMPQLNKKHHKHTNKFRIKSGDIAGFSISFMLGGQRYPIFKPTMFKGKIKGSDLLAIYKKIALDGTESCYTSEISAQFKKIIYSSIQQTKRNRAEQVATKLSNSNSYHNIVRLKYFLLIYLACAGSNNTNLMQIKNKLQISNIIPILEYSAQHIEANQAFPDIKFTTVAELEGLKQEILSRINCAPSQEKIIFNDNVVTEHIQASLVQIQQLSLLNDTMTNSEGKFGGAQNFFPRKSDQVDKRSLDHKTEYTPR